VVTLVGEACGAGDSDSRTYGSFSSFRNEDFAENSFIEDFHGHRRFIGLDFCDFIADFNGVTLLFEPAKDRSLSHGVRELGHFEFRSHRWSVVRLVVKVGDERRASIAVLSERVQNPKTRIQPRFRKNEAN